MKKIVFLVSMIILTSIPMVGWGKGTNNTQVYIDGHRLYFDVTPQSIDGRTMVPLRTIFEALGLEVGWDSEAQKITGRKEGLEIQAWVGKQEAYINGNLIDLDVAPVVFSERTLVPVRFIAEATGAEVHWLDDTNEVIIRSDEAWPASIYIKTIEELPRCNTYGVLAEIVNLKDESIKEIKLRVNYQNNFGEVITFEDLHIKKEIDTWKGQGFASEVAIGDYLISNIRFEILEVLN